MGTCVRVHLLLGEGRKEFGTELCLDKLVVARSLGKPNDVEGCLSLCEQ